MARRLTRDENSITDLAAALLLAIVILCLVEIGILAWHGVPIPPALPTLAGITLTGGLSNLQQSASDRRADRAERDAERRTRKAVAEALALERLRRQ